MTLSLSGGILSDIIKWVRRYVKTSSAQTLSDEEIGDYINRFWCYDLPSNIQLIDFRRLYTFVTEKNIQKYSVPYIPGTQLLQYQTFVPPATIRSVNMTFLTEYSDFKPLYQYQQADSAIAGGTGSVGPYTHTIASTPILRGFSDYFGNLNPEVIVIANSSSGYMYVCDDGNGVLRETDREFQNVIVEDAGSIDYDTGELVVTFSNIPLGTEDIRIIFTPFRAGIPFAILYTNNVFNLYPVPEKAFKIEIEATITPTAFLQTGESVTFSYISEYIALGAARKILADNGDMPQMQMYEPLFKEAENKVMRRTGRQNEQRRIPTIFDGAVSRYGWDGRYNYGNGFFRRWY